MALALLLSCSAMPMRQPAAPSLGRGAMLRNAAFTEFRQNSMAHAQELLRAEDLGYRPVSSLPLPPWRPPPVRPYYVPRDATGMGPVCPFALAAPDPEASALPLVFETYAEPMASMDECSMVVDEARAHIASGGVGATFSYTETSRNIAVHSLPRTQQWLNSCLLPRVSALAGMCFGEAAIGDLRRLRIYRALVVQYDAAAGLTHQEMHRDHSLLTCVITLNDRGQYRGGGTMIEALGQAFAPDRGHALVAASALRHAGHTIEAGERWVMVLFLACEDMRYGENVRHFVGRATGRLMEGDRQGAAHFLSLARAMCDDCDPQLRAGLPPEAMSATS